MAQKYIIDPRPCEYCSTIFKPRSDFMRLGKGGRFCSRACSQAYERDNKPNQDDKFWSKVDIKSENECWPFVRGFTNKDGYGMVRVNNIEYRAHRYSYETKVGPLLPDQKVLHECDNPPCCNPKHLRAGTQGENIKDMMNKKRNVLPPKGSDHHKARVTPEQVIKMREEFKQGLTYQDLQKKYSMSSGAIWCIINRKSWKDI